MKPVTKIHPHLQLFIMIEGIELLEIKTEVGNFMITKYILIFIKILFYDYDFDFDKKTLISKLYL